MGHHIQALASSLEGCGLEPQVAWCGLSGHVYDVVVEMPNVGAVALLVCPNTRTGGISQLPAWSKIRVKRARADALVPVLVSMSEIDRIISGDMHAGEWLIGRASH